MLSALKLKGCRRCSGDLFLEKDVDDSYVFCLQCGAVYVNHVEIPVYRKTRGRRPFARARIRI